MNIYADYSNRLNTACYTQGRSGKEPLVLICHNTEGRGEANTGQTQAEAQQHSDFEAQFLSDNSSQVSVHWVVGEEGAGAPIYRVVPEGSTAYHCGGSSGFPSSWTDPTTGRQYGGYGLNEVAIGIELVGQHYETVGPIQLAALKQLVFDIFKRYPKLAQPGRIVAHASLEGDRQDGRNWVVQAKGWATEFLQTTNVPPITPQPNTSTTNSDNPLQGANGQSYWVIGPIRQFYNANVWLGLPLSPELGAVDHGFDWQGSFQFFERGRVENHIVTGTNQVMLGRVGAELLELQSADK